MVDWKNGEKFIFMQVGAPCHTTKRVKNFLSQKKIPLLPWPGNSPDLNPIEALWKLVKRKMAQKVITTKIELTESLIHIWKHSSEIQEAIQSCIESMSCTV